MQPNSCRARLLARKTKQTFSVKSKNSRVFVHFFCKTMTAEFESWLSGRLGEFNADGEVFSSYILGILDGDDESVQEKEDSLVELLEGLGLDDGQPDPCVRVQNEILSRWSAVSNVPEAISKTGDDANAVDLGATLAAIAENQSKAYAASKKMAKSSDDKDREAVKAAILAQYNNAVEDSEGSDDDDDDAQDHGDELVKNSNAEEVNKAEQEKREKSRQASAAKKEKDKEDREKQKKDGEDRKKKAQDKSVKVERRR
jgi:hypothetical protein